MVGGESVFFRGKQLHPDRHYWINDINAELYCFRKSLQSAPELLVQAVRKIREGTTDGRNLFYNLLKQYGTGTELERAIRFLVLNRITFSGTVDSGGYSEQAFHARFTHSSIRALEMAHHVLRDTTITNMDYAEVVNAPAEDVFLFLDPPYYSAADSRLYGKRGHLHTEFAHQRFAQIIQECPHHWLITYDDCAEVRRLFRDACIVEWQLQYGMNNYKQPTARPGRKLFIANYDIRSRYAKQLALVMEWRAHYSEAD